jgi:predicted AAA+ superfamily ATPase
MYSNSRPPKEMPWDDLVWVFLREAKTRVKQIEEQLITNPLMQLREFRVLTIGGPRQTGKSTLAQQTVRQRDNARLMINTGVGGHGVAHLKLDERVETRRLEPHQLVQSKLKDVVTLVIDNEGRNAYTSSSPYYLIERVYEQHPEWFHPEFSVVNIL